MAKDKDSMSATPLCYRKMIIRLPHDQYTQMHAHKNIGCPNNWRHSYYKHNRGARGFVPPKLGHDENHKKRDIQIGGRGGCMFSNTVTCPPSLHMTLFGWHFTQLGWDYLKPPFVFLSIIMFALSWSYGFSSGKLFAAAPLPPTWLTDVWLFWYTAVTDMFSFLCRLSSLHSVLILPHSVWANDVYKKTA